MNQIQSVLEKTLQAIGGKAMVVGHSPQPLGANWYKIDNSICNDPDFYCVLIYDFHPRERRS